MRRGTSSAVVNRHCPLHDHVTRPSHDCQRILEGLAEKDGNVPFLVDLPVNTLLVIVNALLLGDLQVSEGALTVPRMFVISVEWL